MMLISFVWMSPGQLLQGRQGLFAGLPSLVRLDLVANDLTELRAETFRGLTSLEFLNVGLNDIWLVGEAVFRGLSSLRVLFLTGNPLRGLAYQATLRRG